MKSLKEIQEEIVADFEIYDNWMDKYNLLIDLSKTLLPFDDKYKNPGNLIKGCQSRVWLNAELEGNRVIYMADSDAIITKGIIALLIRVLSGRTTDEIMDADLFFIDKIGLKENLSPTRSNGLVSMVKQMKLYALAYHARLNKEKL